jgi:membrane-associated protease RseP (regulator of RpoE activity)
MGEAAIKAALIDPGSAQIEWPYNFTGGTLKALFGKTKPGWFTCGWVNSKNRMGGYSGRSWFMIEIYQGAVSQLDIGESDGIDPASVTCPSLLKNGLLQPAPGPVRSALAAPAPQSAAEYAAAADSSAQAAAARGGLGISFVPTVAGATLVSVAPGSAGEKAGLKPGETIEALNGIALKGMSPAAMIEVLHSAPASVTLTIVGVGDVKVR